MKKKKGLWESGNESGIRRFRKRVKEYLIFFAAAEALLVFLNYLCYQNIWWLIPEQSLLLPGFRIWRKRQELQRRKVYEKGFRALLQSVATSLQAGYSLENSCRVALRELETLYQGKDNPMTDQMRRIVRGIALHMPLDELFADFARETGLEDAQQFAVLIEIVRTTGGNMVDILKRSMEHMKLKMDAAEEIQVVLSGKMFEKNIMLLMPFFILFYLKETSPEYIACFYTSVTGHLIMSAVIGLTLFCYYWSEKIMNIEF